MAGANKRRYVHAPISEQPRILRDAGLEPAAISPSALYLTETEIAHLPSNIVGIGGHGCRHELLADKNLPELRAELRRVRLWLEYIAPSSTTHGLALAYPNGAHSSVAIAAAIEAGFSAAFTVEPWRPERSEHRWRLRRSCVPNHPSAIADLVAGKELRI